MHTDFDSCWRFRVGDYFACRTQRGLRFGAMCGQQVLHTTRVLVVLVEMLPQRLTEFVELFNWRREKQRALRHRTRGVLAEFVSTREAHDSVCAYEVLIQYISVLVNVLHRIMNLTYSYMNSPTKLFCSTLFVSIANTERN